jgi:fused signal recognition particle receptor
MFDLFKRKTDAAAPKPSPDDAEPRRSWTERLTGGLTASRDRLSGALAGVFRRRALDDEAIEELETALLTSDVGVAATAHLIEDLKARYKRAGRWWRSSRRSRSRSRSDPSGPT